MLNPFRKKRIRIDTMPNSLLREINSLRSKYHALRLTNIGYLDIIGILAYCLSYSSMVSGGYQNLTLFILIIFIQPLILFHYFNFTGDNLFNSID
jgi:hypothetical protein